MILTLGALVVAHRQWLGGGARRAIPFGLVVAAGISALGVAFAAWALAAALVLAVLVAGQLVGRRPRVGEGPRWAQGWRSAEVRGAADMRPAEGRKSMEGRRSGTARRPMEGRRIVSLIGAGAVAALVAAWPTWSDLSGSLEVANEIASTTNSTKRVRARSNENVSTRSAAAREN